MNRKRMVDLAIVCVCLAVFGIAFIYPWEAERNQALLWMSGGAAVLFFILALSDSGEKETGWTPKERMAELPSESGQITELVLLSEEDTELMVWELYGKTALVIGRDIKENQVDVDLNNSPYASMVEIEHAVLNYSDGNWYVEDLGSRNGLSIKKAQDQRTYRLSADTPCKLDSGDLVCVGLNRLLLR